MCEENTFGAVVFCGVKIMIIMENSWLKVIVCYRKALSFNLFNVEMEIIYLM